MLADVPTGADHAARALRAVTLGHTARQHSVGTARVATHHAALLPVPHTDASLTGVIGADRIAARFHLGKSHSLSGLHHSPQS